ncbi:MAG: hypothetical protein RO009_15715 [Pseudorhodoplanes sp.]|jgi:hypothetical protein|nr:hypothetical protein [Pseudorhodoplanes sp.]
MLENTSDVQEGYPAEAMPKGGSKARFLTLADLDRRTSAFRKTEALIVALESDLGGSEALTTGERQLVQRAAVLGSMIEDMETRWIGGAPLDTTAFCTVVNAQRRVLETIGIKRRQRDVTPNLSDYIQNSERAA